MGVIADSNPLKILIQRTLGRIRRSRSEVRRLCLYRRGWGYRVQAGGQARDRARQPGGQIMTISIEQAAIDLAVAGGLSALIGFERQ
jgi:hypothetical protein